MNAQHLTSFNKINSSRKQFKTLNRRRKMKIAINKKSSRTKLSTSNPQQPINSKNTEKPKPQKNQYREAGSKKENSPHSNWSLHNNPPRKFRNIIPEMPTQNMPAQPQSISPLVSQHRSHSCKIKSQS
jgi:hypothetical protein